MNCIFTLPILPLTLHNCLRRRFLSNSLCIFNISNSTSFLCNSNLIHRFLKVQLFLYYRNIVSQLLVERWVSPFLYHLNHVFTSEFHFLMFNSCITCFVVYPCNFHFYGFIFNIGWQATRFLTIKDTSMRIW